MNDTIKLKGFSAVDTYLIKCLMDSDFPDEMKKKEIELRVYVKKDQEAYSVMTCINRLLGINRYLMDAYHTDLFNEEADKANDELREIKRLEQEELKIKEPTEILQSEVDKILVKHVGYLDDDSNPELYIDISSRSKRNRLLESMSMTYMRLQILSGLRINELVRTTFKIDGEYVKYIVSKSKKTRFEKFKPLYGDSEDWLEIHQKLTAISDGSELNVKSITKRINSLIKKFFTSIKSTHHLRKLHRLISEDRVSKNLGHSVKTSDITNLYYDGITIVKDVQESEEEESNEESEKEESEEKSKDPVKKFRKISVKYHCEFCQISLNLSGRIRHNKTANHIKCVEDGLE